MLIAPTEPALVKALGESSSVPERYGVDIMWSIDRWGLVGVQRKEVSDLLSSVTDGRLAKEIVQMQRLGLRTVLVEGKPRWSTDGQLVHEWHGHWSRRAYRNLLRSIQAEGVWVEHSDSLSDTVGVVESMEEWTRKEHKSLKARPGPASDGWGKRSSARWQAHVIQSFPGMGPGRAEKFVEHFGGTLPIGWTVAEEELQEVPGVGPKLAAGLWQSLNGAEET